MSELSQKLVTPALPLEERSCPACGSAARTGHSPASTNTSWYAVFAAGCSIPTLCRVSKGKVLHYDQLARERTDTTSALSPAHYGLANQIKSVGLYERVLRFVAEKIPEGNVNFVDVGCAGGLFLLAAQAIDGYHCGVQPRFSVRGISIDPRERSETERNVGCPVVFPDEAAAQWAGWADVVTLMNVLEHVSAPFELLCQLRRILKPGGLLLIDVPNNAVVSLRGNLFHRWPVLDLGEHINHFVPSTLDKLLIRSGFSPAKRFLGMYKGVESLTIPPGFRSTVRWFGSSAIMLATLKKVQMFPHMTMAYRAET